MATSRLQKEQSDNKKIDYKQFEKWILLDGSVNDTLLMDQIIFLKSQTNSLHNHTNPLPGNLNINEAKHKAIYSL